MKKQSFWALPRLCLCLISCFIWYACAVSREERTVAPPVKSCIITVKMLPGDSGASLFALLTEAGLNPELKEERAINNINDTSEYLRIKISVRDREQYGQMSSWLRNSNIGIRTMQIEQE